MPSQTKNTVRVKGKTIKDWVYCEFCNECHGWEDIFEDASDPLPCNPNEDWYDIAAIHPLNE